MPSRASKEARLGPSKIVKAQKTAANKAASPQEAARIRGGYTQPSYVPQAAVRAEVSKRKKESPSVKRARAKAVPPADFTAIPEVSKAIRQLKAKYGDTPKTNNRINRAAERYEKDTPARQFDRAQNPSITAEQSAAKDITGRPALEAGKVKSFKGKPTAGTPSIAAVTRADRKGTLRTGKGGKLVTPEVGATRKAVKRVSGRLTAARKATSGGKVQSLMAAGLDGSQAKVLAKVLKTGDRMGATEKEKLAAVQTALVEANISNPTVATDHDSLGWRQERQMYYDNPTNIKASAGRFFDETAAAGRGAGSTAGTLAQSVQRSAYPERYDERTAEAQPLLDAFNAGRAGTPKERAKVEQLTKVATDINAEAKKLGIQGVNGLDKQGAKAVAEVFIAKKRKGAYAGSQTIVGKMLGGRVWGDKEPGHSVGGDHDPTVGDAYAQDIQLGFDNPAEGEPTYDTALLNRITKQIRKMGGEIPELEMGMGLVETNVQGYRIQIIPDSEANFHGTGPHLHIGAKWTGEAPPPGTVYGGDSSGGDSSGGYATTSLPLGGGAASTSTASPAAAAGAGPAGRRGRKNDIKAELRKLGFNVTATGVSGGTKSAAAPSTVLADLAKKYS